jgi:predicted transcriptional regulator of viral defense system
MKNTEIMTILQQCHRSLFTTEDLKKLLNIAKENTLYKRIERLINQGILLSITKGKYRYAYNEANDFEIANFIHNPSYLSFESALNFYGILIQTPYQMLSATTARSKTIEVNNKEYRYIHLLPELYFGYRKEKNFLIAYPEKAIIDQLYLAIKGLGTIDKKDLDLNKINRKRMTTFTKRIKNKLLKKKIGEFLK